MHIPIDFWVIWMLVRLSQGCNTNNTVELVIRRFDQHYQNFCGFEKLYRFTPFSQDAQKRIRGKSPLQLAGYPIEDLPVAALCSGLAIDWPTEANLVPNP